MALEKIIVKHTFSITPSPNAADIAVVSVNNEGTAGLLNEQVLKAYGYTIDDLPGSKRLMSGFSAIPDTKGKPVIFVVTLDGRKRTEILLEDNLLRALREYRGWLAGRKVWLPLMGTGAGGLTPEESYNITVKVINRFLREGITDCTFILSLPDSKEGWQLDRILKHESGEKQDSIKAFLQKIPGKFYLAGSVWDSEEQADRFFDEGIWEKGFDDDSYAAIINQIRPGDIIIIKSTFATRNGDTFLRVKALGIVTDNEQDGAAVDVDWRITGLRTDISGLSYYRDTISAVSDADVVTIFNHLDPILWLDLLQAPVPDVPPALPKIAGLISDSEKGLDYLGISQDVTAFARVIAAKNFEPPLAIALFGEWGSGKSFFIRKLWDKIDELSHQPNTDMYCKGVVHIHFNAWSYMDANLWASFVCRIFEGLQEYIRNEKISRQRMAIIKRELSQQLNVTKAGLEVLQDKKTAVEGQIKELEEKRNDARRQVARQLLALKRKTAWKILHNTDQEFNARKRIIETLQSNESLVKTTEELHKIIPDKYWDNPQQAYEQARSAATFLKEFFLGKNVVRNLIWLFFILAVIFMAPLALEAFDIEVRDLYFPVSKEVLSMLVTLGFLWGRAAAIYRKLQPLVASFWKIKEKYEEARSEALANLEQEEKVLTLQIEKGKEEILLLSEQIRKAEVISIELGYRINNALATETLYSFIEDRSQSEDYKKHLGIISTIRKDFEILNGLFIDHKSEVVNQQQAQKFREYFKRPVERIILYIDDLDRCAEENVVQVLEAVNLLMAFPLFVVVVGVDPRWIRNALIKKYALQFAGNLNGHVHAGIEPIAPANYLEKIFQIPFHLKAAPVKSVKEMIRQLAIKSLQPEVAAEETDRKNPAASAAATEPNAAPEDTGETHENPRTDNGNHQEETSSTIPDGTAFLELTATEAAMMEDMGEILGPNPRALKRFVNIFKVIKAHDEYTLDKSLTDEDQLAILFILALSIGRFKKIMPAFETFIHDETNAEQPINAYILQHYSNEETELNNLKRHLQEFTSGSGNFEKLRQIKGRMFNNHYSFINRFTFKWD
ncbi:hypothetical protein ECE50_030455 (plasmid) [Chitinophaga sp. Mgbs1]|uniref:KAP NTPase domain-containing protein n=1 Tax=Chitinophaga solisilvae TaxID=1233460 RepID=A0A3S1B0N2_9BACT|nr:hypothetical protein [Chitinophaga solisilvae]